MGYEKPLLEVEDLVRIRIRLREILDKCKALRKGFRA